MACLAMLLVAAASSSGNATSPWGSRVTDVIPHARPDDLQFQNGRGRLSLSGDQPRTYFLTLQPESEDLFAIPMATTRDDQSTQATVFQINRVSPEMSGIRLDRFLLDEFQTRVVDRRLTLYRGAEREDEVDYWNARTFAPTSRYWTTNPNYAWRYARRNPNFLDRLASGGSHILEFSVPWDAFTRRVERAEIILGAELPQRVHENFERTRRYIDHLAGEMEYLGDPQWGLEFEVLAPPSGRTLMIDGFRKELTVFDAIQARRDQILNATERLITIAPEQGARLRREQDQRLQKLNDEEKFWRELAENRVPDFSHSQPEIGYSDRETLSDFAVRCRDIPRRLKP